MQCSKPGTYSGPLQCLIDTVKGEGPRALYKGALLLLPSSLRRSRIDESEDLGAQVLVHRQ